MINAAESRVHVLLLNWNGWRDTIECLESVFRLDWPDLRVIVCDNGSTDDSEQRIIAWAEGALEAATPTDPLLRGLVWPPVPKPIAFVRYDRDSAEQGGDGRASDASLVLVQTGANLGFAGGNNVGLRYLLARGESGHVWVLNNDTVVAPDALTALVNSARSDARIGAVGSTYLDYEHPGRVVEHAGGRLSRWTGWTRPARTERETDRLDFVKGASVLISIETLARIGPMDDRFFLYSEDVDWSLTLRARGYRLAHAPESRVWHKEGASSGHRSPVHDYHSVRSALTLVGKRHPWRLPVAVAYSAARCAAPKLMRGEWKRLDAVLRAWRDLATTRRARGDASPLRGRHLVQNRGWNAWLRASDAALAALSPRGSPSAPPPPRRLLVAIGGHLGDAVIATSVLPVLARAFPGIEIGVLVGSWARQVIDGHPLAGRVHTLDHWRVARGDGTLVEKVTNWQRDAARVVDELHEADYDTAVDLAAYYPNAAGPLHRAGIPVRIGWVSGGYGSLYTHTLEWAGGARHTSEQQVELLRAHWPREISAALQQAPLAYDMPRLDERARERVRMRLHERGIDDTGYLIVHLGAGDSRKEWPASRWGEVIRRLSDDGEEIVLTGSGARDRVLAHEVADGIAAPVNLVDQLTWPELRAIVADARAVLTVDTVVSHLAAAEGVPCVVVRAGMSDARHWRPLAAEVRIVTNAVACAPCFRSRGCAQMTCIRGVGANTVLEAARVLAGRAALSDPVVSRAAP